MSILSANLPYQSYHISGNDALTFLQGQLTQDISLLSKSTCQPAGYCNAKGQLFATLLIRKASDGFIVRLHQGVADAVIKRLTMFKLREAVNITPLNALMIGLNHAAALQFVTSIQARLPSAFDCLSGDGFSLCALPHSVYELTVDNVDVQDNLLSGIAGITDNPDTIAIERLQAGHFNIYPETTEQLLPQETTLESYGGINYQKGCYVGQEIIARSKYRGKVRKGMGYAAIDAAVHLPLPAAVQDERKTVGQVVDAYQTQFNTYCLAILSLDSFDQPVTVAGQTTTFTPFS